MRSMRVAIIWAPSILGGAAIEGRLLHLLVGATLTGVARLLILTRPVCFVEGVELGC